MRNPIYNINQNDILDSLLTYTILLHDLLRSNRGEYLQSNKVIPVRTV